MKKFTSILLITVLLSALCTFGVSADETIEVLPKASEWETVVIEEDTNTGLVAEAPSGWLNNTDTATWVTAQAPFTVPQWSNPIGNTRFDFQFFSAFLRTTFTIDKASAVNELTMSVIYDENPTVYINGTQVWSATGYKDSEYITIDLTNAKDALKDGKNTVCVVFSNVYGGSVFDMALSANVGDVKTVDAEGKVIISSVSASGFVPFGAINAPENILDMDQNTCTGSGFNADVEQSVTMNFKAATTISEVFVQCKDEGTTTNEDGTRGTYDIYAYKNGKETKLGSLKAVTGTDGGATLKLSAPLEADSVKIVITSWQGDCWACVADAYVVAADNSTPVKPPVTGEGTVFIVLIAMTALFGSAVALGKAKKVF